MEKTTYTQTAFSLNVETARDLYIRLKKYHPVIETKMGAPKRGEINPYVLFVDTVISTMFRGSLLNEEEKEGLKKKVKEGSLLKVSSLFKCVCPDFPDFVPHM
jgi:hypothetical protein